jgi:ribonuclease J
MSDFVDVIPLGGLGEFGMNCSAVRCGSDMLLIDAGMAFPRGDQGAAMGVRVIVPDFTYLHDNRDSLRGVVLTHGHEDHIGAVSYLASEFDVPFYGSRLTLGLVRERLRERQLLERTELIEIGSRELVRFGAITVEPLKVTHSFPDSFCLAISTPQGCLIWTGDFKFDQTPVDGKVSDIHRLATYGEDGVLALFSDSTNSQQPGSAPSESSVIDPLRTLFRKAEQKIIVSTFSSSIHRIQIIFRLAEEFGRVVVPVGRSMVNNVQIAAELGRLSIPDGLLATVNGVRNLPPDQVIVLASGSQGEPMAAFSRLALDQFKNLQVDPGDLAIVSTRIIPGNEKSISRMVNHLYRRGASVFDLKNSFVHVSGHGFRDELKLMINLTQPQFFVPIHGEFSQLKSHSWIAREQGVPEENILLIENGDRLRLTRDAAEVVDTVPVGRRFIDDGILEEVHEIVLRERRYLSEDGFVVVILRLDHRSGELIGEPALVSRGFVLLEESEELVTEATNRVFQTVRETSLEEKQDNDVFSEIIRKDLRRLFRKRTGKRPIVLSFTFEI